MTTTQFLAEWALRSSILIVSGALLLRGLRVKDASIRLAAWVAILCGSLTLPFLTKVLPGVTLGQTPFAVVNPAMPGTVMGATTQTTALFRSNDVVAPSHAVVAAAARKFWDLPWTTVALSIYFVGASVLLLRLLAGAILIRRLSVKSRATGRSIEGIEIRESEQVTGPVAVGIVRPAIILPGDWNQWEPAKLEAVLAHECAHIRRKDPAVQLLSAMHRAILWHSPLSWFLHQRIVRLAEEASDDAALAIMPDRTSYAQLLLEFVQRAAVRADWRAFDAQTVSMARYGKVDARISRILDGASLSSGVTAKSVLAILVLGVPLAVLVAAPQVPVAPVAPAAPASPVAPRSPAAAPSPTAPAPPVAPQSPAAPAAPAAFSSVATAEVAQTGTASSHPGRSIHRYMIVSGDSTMSGSWNSDDPSENTNELRAKYGPKFAWFSTGGHDYVVTDAGVLKELDEAMAPQREVNRMQDEVNRQQDTVNQHQSDVNRAQDGVNEIQNRANHRQDLLNELQSAQGNDDLIRKLEKALAELRSHKGELGDQESANREQAKVNAMQNGVNQEQGKVNEQQHKVNQAQEKVSAQYEGRMEAILQSALQRHLTQQIQ